MESNARVCPFCGEPPGPGVFCAACGRNLGAVEQLPTRVEWEHGQPSATQAAGSIAARCAEATAGFLDAMRAAGNPGAGTFTTARKSAFGRAARIQGWVVRPVEREDFEEPRRYEPGLVLTVDGRFHRLDSELRGWGQRDFPSYQHTASADPVEPPADDRLPDELAAVRAASGVPGAE